MSDAAAPGLRIQLHTGDPVRRRGLAAMVEAAGHHVVADTPDVVVCDLDRDTIRPAEAEAPVIVLTDHEPRGESPAGMLPRDVTAEQLDPALRAVAAGLLVRLPAVLPRDGFRAVGDEPPPALLTPREAEILSLIGQGMSNKAVARQLGISVHTVKFHLEALFAKLEATSRAEAVAKGLRGGVIELQGVGRSGVTTRGAGRSNVERDRGRRAGDAVSGESHDACGRTTVRGLRGCHCEKRSDEALSPQVVRAQTLCVTSNPGRLASLDQEEPERSRTEQTKADRFRDRIFAEGDVVELEGILAARRDHAIERASGVRVDVHI